MAKYYTRLGEDERGLSITSEGAATLIRPIGDNEEGEAVHADFAPVIANLQTGEGVYSLIADGKSYQVNVERTDEGLRILVGRYRFEVEVLTEREWRLQKVAPRQTAHGGRIAIKAPMPGLVKAVLAAPGDAVAKGQRLVVLEAMKMENEIMAPRDGVVAEVHVSQGATVESGKPLITLE